MKDAKRKWNDRYKERLTTEASLLPNEKLTRIGDFFNGGVALDIACGLGGNSLFLAEKGFEVHAIDISDVAINFLKEETARKKILIRSQVCDLTDYDHLPFQKELYDLVVLTNYLDRNLFPIVKKVIKKKGYFFMDTFCSSGEDRESSNMPEVYQLKSQELLKKFGDWKIIAYEEIEGRQMIFCQNH